MGNLFIKFWYGKIPLWKSYWIVGEIINAFIIPIIFIKRAIQWRTILIKIFLTHSSSYNYDFVIAIFKVNLNKRISSPLNLRSD